MAEITRWQSIRPDFTATMLQGLYGLWFRSEKLDQKAETELREVYQNHSFGQTNFNTWSKQTIRQIFENAITKGE